ncbi:MAG TPA: AIR synthase-related protein, partial [Planctomycetota bacterium]|nr:AIR synthase-related protein [Planctomycetota bacterium]
ARWEAATHTVFTPANAHAPGRDGRFDADLLAILRSWNVCSKEWVVRQYDHEVQGTSVVKPFTGARDDGPSDAAVLAPVHGRRRGIAISCGLNPRYGEIDPWRMGAAAVDEAVRNAVAVGADPERCAVLDNFSWGDCSLPDRLGALVLAAEGASAAAVGLGAPFISGKDSLNNEYRTATGRLAIPGTLLVSCLAIHADVARAVTLDLKRPGDLVYLLGATAAELGGSHLHLVRRLTGGQAPRVDLESARATYRALHAAIRAGIVRACHDLSEGGLAVAAAEMALAGRMGLALELPEGDPAALLFSESCGRLLVEVAPEDAPALERALNGTLYRRTGYVTTDGRLAARDASGNAVLSLEVDLLADAFREPLYRALGEVPPRVS